MPVDVAVVIGTRPEAIKMAPVMVALREAGLSACLLSTGQHRELLHGALAAFGLKPDLDLALMQAGQTLPGLTARLAEGLDQALEKLLPRFVLVQGDTTTAMMGALAAFYRRIPCGHVEAGLRSGDRYAPWPEEMNRLLCDRLCTRYYPPTERSLENLRREGVAESNALVSGQTGVDAALWMAKKLGDEAPAEILPHLRPESKLIFATGHRRESFEGGIRNVAAALRRAVEARADLYVIYPAHPNPSVRAQLREAVGAHERLRILEPVDYPAAIWLMSHAALIVSDSGGIQEEAPSFGVPVLVTRDVTERPEGISAGFLRLVGTETERVFSAIEETLEDGALRSRLQATPNPYGDGCASQRIAADIKDSLSRS